MNRTFIVIIAMLVALLFAGLVLLGVTLISATTPTSIQNSTEKCYIVPDGWDVAGITDQYAGYAQLYLVSNEGNMVKRVEFTELSKVEC